MSTTSPRVVFTTIVFAQFCGTSLWFAGNAIVLSLQNFYDWPQGSSGHLTTSVQAGFITGTLVIALTGLADRISPSRLFLISSLLGALSNAAMLIDISSFKVAIISRVLTGICLGGVYPVGMKIAADWRKEGLGDWLGALVGALVIGTALPHALRSVATFEHPTILITAISVIAGIGGIILYLLVPDGPFRKASQKFSLTHIQNIFRSASFRAPLFGYFGHMWELYTLWAFVPWILIRYQEVNQALPVSTPLLTFMVIAAGGFGCWAGGKISLLAGSMRVARFALAISALCCLFSGLLWTFSPPVLVAFMILWGISVAADSPQFSALVAANAPQQNKGTALTIATCVGFAITIVSIQFLHYLENKIDPDYLLMMLTPGPLAGLYLSTSK